MQAGPELEAPQERPVPGAASKGASRRYQSLGYRGKRVLLGPPLKTSQLVHERITKRVTLAVFSSDDPISSTVASVAGAALLIDDILTVAVSVSSGVGNLSSAFGPDNPLRPWQVEIAVGFIVLLARGDLRGIREAGRMFAIPTYLYVFGMGAVVVVGIVRVLTGSIDKVTYSAADQMGSLFVGISFLAGHLGIKPFQGEVPTVVAQLGRHVPGANPFGHAFFLLTQGATLMILVLAAVAILLVVAFHASTSAPIPLYAIGVITSLTLSQAGMVKRHWRRRERGWRYGLANGVGGTVTLVVAGSSPSSSSPRAPGWSASRSRCRSPSCCARRRPTAPRSGS